MSSPKWRSKVDKLIQNSSIDKIKEVVVVVIVVVKVVLRVMVVVVAVVDFHCTRTHRWPLGLVYRLE